MAPGEEEEAEFVHHIRIGHIEVVLEHRDGDETAELWGCSPCMVATLLDTPARRTGKVGIDVSRVIQMNILPFLEAAA